MSRGSTILVAGLGGFVVAFLAVQVYMWPDWHRDDCGELDCVGALAVSLMGGLFIGFAVMIIAALTAAGVTAWRASREAGDSPFDENA